MDKNDMSASLALETILSVKKDLDTLGAGRADKVLVKQLGEKIAILEKIVMVKVINAQREQDLSEQEPNDSQEQPPQQPEFAPPAVPETQEDPETGERIFTLEELNNYNGRDGRPTYVAYDGVVYDVSNSSRWSEGNHFGLPSGRDLTIQYRACHAGRPRIEQMPVVGRLAPESP